MRSSKAPGKLMAIGGAEDKTGEQTILKEFVRIAGAKKARVVVMTAATSLPVEVAAEYIKVLTDLGAGEVRAIDVSQRADAMKPESVETVEQATAVFFTGGDQLHITSLMGGTDLQNKIRERFDNNNLLVAGTSAGAAMMGSSMIMSGDSNENPKMGAVELAPGENFIAGCIVDTHFSQRGRHGRLIAAVGHYPQNIGFGIDENTAMIVDAEKLTVIGDGSVTIINGGAISYTTVPYAEKSESLAVFDIKLHVLSRGHNFDLHERTPFVVPQSKSHEKSATAAAEN